MEIIPATEVAWNFVIYVFESLIVQMLLIIDQLNAWNGNNALVWNIMAFCCFLVIHPSFCDRPSNVFSQFLFYVFKIDTD